MASSSASTSTSTADGNCYQHDVFINHRGPDVKKTFASHLYRRLKAHGLRVFLDQEELQKGDNLTPQIKSAIRTASVHIAIFSTNYCQSRWCLDELVLMVQSKRNLGSTIIPVFYDVKPSELRWTEGDSGVYTRALRMFKSLWWTQGEIGVYAQALRNLAEKKTFVYKTGEQKLRYDSNTIRKWRDALSDVAEISGFELEAYNGRDEGQLLDDLVERVLEIVPKTPLDVSKYPTGLDDKLKDFEERVLLQQHENGKVRVVGIVGFGGIGKTTLAKQFFNRERSHYPRSCFLFDVRGSSLKSLQSTLLDDLTPLSEQIKQINSTAEGIEKLRKHLSSSRALIILDDVDNNDQLDALLLPARDFLQSKSLILVTSRHKDVLISSGIAELSIYKLQGLGRKHSTELFCLHAFHQPEPVAGFEQVVNAFVDACDGLPLSIKVIGALLYSKNIKYWKAQLHKISKILPDQIQKTLKISYDSLDHEEKQIFLDIACFFIGEDKDTAIRIWNGCGSLARLCLQKLDDKCLVEFHRKKCTMLDPVMEVEGKDCIKMHDHLRDLGRSLAEIERGRRLWGQDFELSPNSWVLGITNFSQCSSLLPYMSDWRLSSLLLLRAEGCVDEVLPVSQLTQLRWLHWSNYPYSHFPSHLPMQNLRVLYIKSSKLTELDMYWWPHVHEVTKPLQLRELHIATDGPLEIPSSIGQLQHLKKIVLEPDDILKRMRLKTFPDEFGDLQSLKHLELRSCSNLMSFPDCFCRLTNLEHINLYECSGLQWLPDAFGELINLRHLRLSHSQLQTFPDSFGSLTNLQRMDLKFSKFQIIPDSFARLINLQHLDLSHCSNLATVPSVLDRLTNLQSVNLSHCISLETIPYSWSMRRKNLEVWIYKCNRLKIRPSNTATTTEYNKDNYNLTLGSWFSQLPHTFAGGYNNNNDNSTSRRMLGKSAF